MKPAALAACLVCWIALLWSLAVWADTDNADPAYVGSESCRSCHSEQFAAWETSHHALAWAEPSPASVLGDFEDARFAHSDGSISQFTKDGEDFRIAVTERDGSASSYKVQSVAGVEPLQQYLLEGDRGQLQSFDVAWDVARQTWFHLYPDLDLAPGMGLHWTGPYKNWNARCAECHATNFQKNFSPASHRYQSAHSELGVGCEACHGPGQAHLQWAGQDDFAQDLWQGVTSAGLTIGYGGTSEKEIQQCAGCHSRREAFGAGNPLPGTPFHDAYRLALLREGLYHADGTIEDEAYVYGSFLQSKMYDQGVRCSNCHEVHSAGMVAEGNGVCTQCHSPAGNQAFPSLTLKDYDSPTHHFHPADAPGALCVSCHMVERVFMEIDGRRDHSFRVPRPDLSVEIGTPNACNDCHQDSSPEWADATLREWFPVSAYRGQHFGQLIAAGRADASGHQGDLAALARDQDAPAIVRATALSLLAPLASSSLAADLAPLLKDDEPLVRAAAVPLQRHAADQQKVSRLLDVLDDSVAAVRLAAAKEMLSLPIAHLPPRHAASFQSAVSELQAVLRAGFDLPEGQLANAGIALVLRNFPAAEKAFREAVILDPQLVEAWRMLVTLDLLDGDKKSAQTSMAEALKHNPGSSLLQGLARQIN
ncbi:MAG: multiheme c-type cytochrome [Pseudomonadota bacterium]